MACSGSIPFCFFFFTTVGDGNCAYCFAIRRPARASGMLGPEGSTGAFSPFRLRFLFVFFFFTTVGDGNCAYCFAIRRPARASGMLGPEGSTGAFSPFGFDSHHFLYFKRLLHSNSLFFLVKVMGIEPMSESISTAASPSAAYVFLFCFWQRP